MFKVGDKALDHSGHIFLIEKTQEEDFGSGLLTYYVLTPCFKYDFNEGYHTFVPIERVDEILIPLMSKKEIEDLLNSFATLETFPNVNPRARKTFFSKVIQEGNRTDLCKVIKTLLIYKEERLRNNKPVSEFDRKMLLSLINLLENEISIVLDIPLEQSRAYLKEKIDYAL